MQNFIKYFATRKHIIIYMSLLFWGFVAYTADPRANHGPIFFVVPIWLLAIILFTFFEGKHAGRIEEAKKYVESK